MEARIFVSDTITNECLQLCNILSTIFFLISQLDVHQIWAKVCFTAEHFKVYVTLVVLTI